MAMSSWYFWLIFTSDSLSCTLWMRLPSQRMKTKKARARVTQTPVQKADSLKVTSLSFLWKTPRSIASRKAMRIRKHTKKMVSLIGVVFWRRKNKKKWHP